MSKFPQDSEKDRETSDLEDDEMFARRDKRGQGVVTDFVRRAIENTVGQVQNTGNLSREAITYLDKGRKEVLRIVAKEVGDFLRHVDISSEVIKVLTGVQMDFTASVKFRHADGKVQPEFSSQSGVSVTKESKEEPPPAVEEENRSDT